MITIFSSPRPFTDPQINLIQRNALASWKALPSKPQIILLGDDAGTAEVCAEFGFEHRAKIIKNSAGMPRRDDLFKQALAAAKYDHVCFISADIIVLDDPTALLPQINLPQFLLTARRFDLDWTTIIDYGQISWTKNLRDTVARSGKLHGPAAIDLALFPKNIPLNVQPPFPVNLPGWDGWFLRQFKKAQIPIIDATASLTLIHQNHGHRHHAGNKRTVWRRDPEAKRILRQIGGFSQLLTLREADWRLTPTGLQPLQFPGNILSKLGNYQIYRQLLGIKRVLWQYIPR